VENDGVDDKAKGGLAVRSNWFSAVLAGAAVLVGAQLLRAQDDEEKAEVRALYRRAEALKEALHWKEAAEVYEKAVAKAKIAYGAENPATATLLNNLALLYQDMGEHARAEPLYQRALKIDEATRGKDHPAVATSLSNLAELYKAMGQHARAEPLHRRSLAIREAKLGKDHLDVALSLSGLAGLV
jgi:tetratricopeptide (TPR) repeat protein